MDLYVFKRNKHRSFGLIIRCWVFNPGKTKLASLQEPNSRNEVNFLPAWG